MAVRCLGFTLSLLGSGDHEELFSCHFTQTLKANSGPKTELELHA